ncbi:hypothetical protein [Rhodococcus tibetensis]|uniref:Uncharacterized protein n=1 Tax=Rhodococcus tibetensis TaxID=2965064 RepID=A0ABT1QC80_9NOCA|nr:hypothetical protein [Rhodococcus sp. FXJ9.536]MCQ4119861.1 hypothetical protein [Rhodococcus sp. FXJ9.536]
MTMYATTERDGSAVTVVRASGDLVCLRCPLIPGRDVYSRFTAADIPTMLDHLDFHQILGQHVPPATFLRLRTEHADNFEKGPR